MENSGFKVILLRGKESNYFSWKAKQSRTYPLAEGTHWASRGCSGTMEIRGRLLLDLIGLWMRILTVNDGWTWQYPTTSDSPGAPLPLPSKQDWNTMRDKGTEWGSQKIMSLRCLECDICFWLKKFLYWIQLPFLQDTQQQITSIYEFQYVYLKHRQRLFGAQWKCNYLKIKLSKIYLQLCNCPVNHKQLGQCFQCQDMQNHDLSLENKHLAIRTQFLKNNKNWGFLN